MSRSILKARILSFLREAEVYLPKGGGWKIEVRLFKDDGTDWRFNPGGVVQVGKPAPIPITVEVSEITDSEA